MARLFRFATDEGTFNSKGKPKQTDYEIYARQADDGFENRLDLRLKLPAVWREWREMGAMKFALLEDFQEPSSIDRPVNTPPAIIAFAILVFLREDFVQEALANPAPHLSIRVVERHLAGKSPIMTMEEVAAGNPAESSPAERVLNLFLAHYTERFPPDCTDEEREDARNSMMQKLLETHRGLHLRRMLYEVFGKEHYEYALTTGMQPLSDYSEYYSRLGKSLPDESQRPYLVGTAYNIVKFGSTIAPLFKSPLPKFGFDAKQQIVLWVALFVDDDEAEIARNLSDSVFAARFFLKANLSRFHLKKRIITPVQVRNCWRSILETVESVDESFFAAVAGDVDDAAPVEKARKQRALKQDITDKAAGSRKKRRRVLKYIREHIEELQPRMPRPASKNVRHVVKRDPLVSAATK